MGMSTEQYDQQSLKSPEADEIIGGTPPTAQERAVLDARRALDRAVMAIFELAFSLESLSDAIRHLDTDSQGHAQRADEVESTPR